MPRKIPDLEDKIIQSAATLFLSKGYQNVSMKDVAVLAGTSVGNLYNYFPAKKDLFLAGRKQWMGSYGESIQGLLEKPAGTKEELVTILLSLLETLERWSGLYEEFLLVIAQELSHEENAQLRVRLRGELREMFINKMDIFLKKLSQQTGKCGILIKDMDNRLTITLLSLVKGLVQFHGEEKEVNRQFIKNIVEIFFGNCNFPEIESSQRRD